jgi:hypothetical protein
MVFGAGAGGAGDAGGAGTFFGASDAEISRSKVTDCDRLPSTFGDNLIDMPSLTSLTSKVFSFSGHFTVRLQGRSDALTVLKPVLSQALKTNSLQTVICRLTSNLYKTTVVLLLHVAGLQPVPDIMSLCALKYLQFLVRPHH